VARAGAEAGLAIDPDRIRFEKWFYYVPGEIYAEHGQQYDYYNSFRYVLSPVITRKRLPTIALPMGNLSNRRLMSQMGFFNPHASDYILNVFSYVTHWLRHYAFSRRGILANWFFGSLAVLGRLLETKRKVLAHPPDQEALLAEQSERSGVSLDDLHKLDALKRMPIATKWYRVVREFWIDRLVIALTMSLGTVALAVSGAPLWVKLMIPLSSFPLLYLIYEWFAHGETIFSHEEDAVKYARKISKLLPTRVVTFGHSHAPTLLPVSRGVSYANTGTWAPVWLSQDPVVLRPGLRNTLTVIIKTDGPAEVRLESRIE